MLISSRRQAADPMSICPTSDVDQNGKLATIQLGWASRTRKSNPAHSKMSGMISRISLPSCVEEWVERERSMSLLEGEGERIPHNTYQSVWHLVSAQ